MREKCLIPEFRLLTASGILPLFAALLMFCSLAVCLLNVRQTRENMRTYHEGRSMYEEDPEGLAELNAWLKSRSIPQPEARPVHDFLDRWIGRYRVEEGRFHLQPELRPSGELNVNADFYTNREPWIRTMEIRKAGDLLLLICNDDPGLEVRLDGRWVPQPAQSEMPAYQYSCAAGTVDDEALTIVQWYYQTCFKTRLIFRREGEKVRLFIRKERLHDDVPYIHMEAVLCREYTAHRHAAFPCG